MSWILDADIRGFYDAIDHEWLRRFVEHRIADKRVLRLIWKWLNAGVIEDGSWSASEEGAPQGASASPLLANVYLHYVFDLRWPGVSLSGCELAEGTVGPGGVVVQQVFGQHPAQMVLTDDQHPVQELPSQGADHPLSR